MSQIERIKFLENEVKRHKKLYYAGRPEISDFEFDKLEEELESIDPANPVLNLIGSICTNLSKIQHKTKMLSLAKTYEIAELEKWIGKNEVVSAFKIDGISCSLTYKLGKLVLGKTRGDGVFGEDILSKVRWIQEIPQEIKQVAWSEFEVRGEIFCTEEDFLELSNEMERRELDKPTSQRNIVAGLIGRKENVDLCHYLKFSAFDLLFDEQVVKTEWEKVSTLEKFGFWTPYPKLHKSNETLAEAISESQKFMQDGDFQIDGLVFTFNSIELHNELGETAHHPKYRMAFKFAGETKVTTIKEIEWSVSRNGVLTPVAHVGPVVLSGAEISRVTLHNLGMVRQFELKSGDEILIVRSGEVIPKFLEVKSSSGQPLVIPTHCPSCHKKVMEAGIRLICNNDNCPAKVEEAIVDFVQKIGIEDLSTKRIQELIGVGLVHDPSDLFILGVSDFLTLEKVKEKLANKFYENIQKSKQVTLPLFLFSLGISGVGLSKCEKIVDFGFDTLDKVLDLKIEDLLRVDGFAEKSAQEFCISLALKKHLIKKLIKAGIVIKKPKVRGHILEGAVFCITGALREKRSLVEKMIRDNGGRVSSNVSKETTHLLTNEEDSSSSKFVKAKQLGTKIINEDDFMGIISNEKN